MSARVLEIECRRRKGNVGEGRKWDRGVEVSAVSGVPQMKLNTQG